MLYQIQIHPDPNASHKDKGDFFEQIMRYVMETQRYEVINQINFTGTEIDLLCKHLDRPQDVAIVECKAKIKAVSEDVKNFVFDVMMGDKAEYGFFVHTSELNHQAAGMVEDLKKKYPKQLIFWGPEKVIDLLVHHGHIAECIEPDLTDVLTPEKRILVYSYMGRFWVTLYSNKMLPSHYHVSNASSVNSPINSETLEWLLSNLDELQGLVKLDDTPIPSPISSYQVLQSLDAVAEIQEAVQWDDYRPVGTKYFVGRKDIRQQLYQFINHALDSTDLRRVFFVEGKSGWGKSSLLAQLRARSRNTRNKNTFYVLAVDSRSANTGEFVSIAMAKLISRAARDNFIPSNFAEVSITSSLDILASDQMQELLNWLNTKKKILVIVFDQFEDVFRKEDLFRTFHKLMLDVHEQQGALITGFSWKSEINIPIDNRAYSLWQQARDLAMTFRMEEFFGYEVDQVLAQLEQESEHQLPFDLRRRLKESSQGFPWLTKKLAIHCYQQIKAGILPEELLDKNLNVSDLFEDDLESLSPEETRALRLIAQRGYIGDLFDVSEVDDKVQENEINSLLGKRIIIRSGSKYNVYWDVFRDYLVEGRVPTLGESFLLRQYPTPCVNTLELLLTIAPCTMVDLSVAEEHIRVKEGTIDNRVRELRYMGAVIKTGDEYNLRPSIRSVNDFQEYIANRLDAHVVIQALRKLSKDTITHDDIVTALRDNFRGYQFSDKTWSTYASYLTSWLRYVGIDFGRRLSDSVQRAAGTIVAFTPQWRPEKDIELFLSFRDVLSNGFDRSRQTDKGFYDLKALGLVSYDSKTAQLTKRGLNLIKLDDSAIRKEIAILGVKLNKLRAAYESYSATSNNPQFRFEENIAPILDSIASAAYRKVTVQILKLWGRFIYEQLE